MAWISKPRSRHLCLAAGDYDAELVKADKAVSKAGNDMAALVFKISHAGSDFAVRDWIVAGNRYTQKKLQDLARSMGLSGLLESRKFRLSEQIGGTVRVRIGIENHHTYGWTNRIEAYIDFDKGTGASIDQSGSEFAEFDFTDPDPPY